jgi:hypothetical protein
MSAPPPSHRIIPRTRSFIDFPDNQEILDLIEAKPLGLLAILDSECLFPRGNDQTLARKYNKELGTNRYFSVNEKQKVNFQFVVAHYAAKVCYDTVSSVDFDDILFLFCNGSYIHRCLSTTARLYGEEQGPAP